MYCWLTVSQSRLRLISLVDAAQYETARDLVSTRNMFFNDRKPLMVVFTGSQADVAAAIQFAAQRRLPLCARAGGHDHLGASICDGGVVVDVSKLKQVRKAVETYGHIMAHMWCRRYKAGHGVLPDNVGRSVTCVP